MYMNQITITIEEYSEGGYTYSIHSTTDAQNIEDSSRLLDGGIVETDDITTALDTVLAHTRDIINQ